jgi:GNAT superfamily N-acetyltransferase
VIEAARPATEEDVPRIAELVAEATAELAATRGGVVWAAREARPLPAEESLAKALADPRQHLLAGEIDGVVVGYAAVRLEDLRTGETLGVVDDIYVEPPARGVSVGELLMDAALAWCEEQGCMGVDSLALPGNRDTKNFFERFGLTARAIIVHRRLRPDEPEDG